MVDKVYLLLEGYPEYWGTCYSVYQIFIDKEKAEEAMYIQRVDNKIASWEIEERAVIN